MRFCDFINKLKQHFACLYQDAFVLDIFTALCGGDAPVGLTGDDASYRKLLFSGNNKKYTGLSEPIKQHVRNNKNKDTFLAYCDGVVSLKEYPSLCDALEVESDTNRFILFEAIYEQFLEFARCKYDNTVSVIPDKVSEMVRLRGVTDSVSVAPLYGGDDFAVLIKPQNMEVNLFRDFIVSWTIKNTGSLIWDKRYLYNVNGKQKGVRGKTISVDIPTLKPDEKAKLQVTINAKGHEMTSDSIWEIRDSEGNPCFPNKQGAITVTVNVINPNRKTKTEVF